MNFSGKRPEDLYPVFEVDINKAHIEFENEQIYNIRLEGKKEGDADKFFSIDPDARLIYVKIGEQLFNFSLPKRVSAVKKKYTYFEKQVDRQAFYLNQKYIGDISLRIHNVLRGENRVTTTDDSKNGGSKKSKNKKLSLKKDALIITFDYDLILHVDLAAFKDYTNDKSKADPLMEYLNNGKLLEFAVKFYADRDGNSLLADESIRPNLVLGNPKIDTAVYNKSILEVTYTKAQSGIFPILDSLKSTLLSVYHPSLAWTTKDTSRIAKTYLRKNSFRANGDKVNKADFFPANTPMIFTNPYPISYSTKEDVTYYRSNKNPRKQKRLYFSDNQHFILLRDVMSNDYIFYNNTENYSPRDQVIEISDVTKSKPIYKELTKDILQARIYSDFIGFDEDNPNGLVQTEVSKRFFLNTASVPSFGNFLYSGYFNYIEPSLLIAKVEQNNKFLELQSLSINDQDAPVNFVSSLDILNYSSFRVGAQIGVAYFSIPKYHIRMELGLAGFINQSGFAREKITADTVVNQTIIQNDEFLANSFVYYPDLRIVFNPDPRFGLELAYRPTQINLLSNNIRQVDNQEEFIRTNGENKSKQFVHVLQLMASIRVNSRTNGQFFFRSNFSILGDDRNSNFLQAQLGYAFSIFSNTGDATKGIPRLNTNTTGIINGPAANTATN